MKNKTHRNCANPECNQLFRKYKTTDKYCKQACKDAVEGKPEAKPRARINPVSDKLKVDKLKYTVARIEFLGKSENKYCVIRSCKCTNLATTIEHTRGREGFADDEARDNNITLLNDVRFWLPACNPCNLELENNAELSKQFQLSKIHGGKKE